SLLAGGNVPEPDRQIVMARRGEPPPIRAKRDCDDPISVRLDRLDLAAAAWIPEQDEAPAAPGDQCLGVRAEGDCSSAYNMSFEGPDLPARLYFPELDGPVHAGGGQRLAIRAESHVHDGGGVALQEMNLVPGSHIPDSDGLVLSARSCTP